MEHRYIITEDGSCFKSPKIKRIWNLEAVLKKFEGCVSSLPNLHFLEIKDNSCLEDNHFKKDLKSLFEEINQYGALTLRPAFYSENEPNLYLRFNKLEFF